jgi:hypothetical protein
LRAGGRKPFGYELNGMNLIPAEAAAVRQGFADLLAGVPLAQIARTWNAAGLYSGQEKWSQPRPRQLAEWSHDTVRLVLKNPRYAGLRAFRGQIVASAKWPAIVDEETWRAAVAVLSDPARSKDAARRDQRLLTGVALCGVCGHTVHAGGGPTDRGYAIYRFSHSQGHVSRKTDPIEAYVSDVVVERLSRPDAAELLVNDSRPDVDALRARAMMLRHRIDDLYNEYVEDDEDVLDAAKVRGALGRLRGKLADVESQMADAGRADLFGHLVQADDTATAWTAVDTARQRAIIDALMVVRIHPVGRGVRTFRPDSVEIRRKL